ncbi:hypothetical protein VTJ04DRAFT_9369 [Mycothermus thermophilus]|uniref:uncharacterized protein n=1 Tax=Humicola insolens TaxID=85995 RepID=UPI0037443BE8
MKRITLPPKDRNAGKERKPIHPKANLITSYLIKRMYMFPSTNLRQNDIQGVDTPLTKQPTPRSRNGVQAERNGRKGGNRKNQDK